MSSFLDTNGLRYLWSKILGLVSGVRSELQGKQDTLVSGTNIKTINNTSILGSGNISISGGDTNVIESVKVNGSALTPDGNKAVDISVPTALSGLTDDTTHRLVTDTEKTTWNNKASNVTVVDHETGDTTFTLTPNVFHKWGEVASLTLTLGTETSGIYNEFMFQFESGSTATTLSLPSTVEWVNTPTIETGKTYQVSIVNNIALIVGV